MISFGVLASGNGTNFQALLDGIQTGEIKGAEIKCLITNHANAGVVARARKAGIAVHIVAKENFKSREEMDMSILRVLESHKVDYVYLLGYMLLLKAPEIFKVYKNRIINLHPALLPSFAGLDAQGQAYNYGCKVSGVTIHLVTPELDAGPILYQKCIDITNCKSGEEVRELMRPLEHECVKTVAQMLTKGKFVVDGRRTKYVPQ